MPDTNTQPAAGTDTGLAEALAASLSPIASMTLEASLARKAELLGNARSLDELSQAELEEFHAICVHLRHLNQPAGKPAAKSKKQVTTAASVAGDFA